MVDRPGHPVFGALRLWLEDYFSGIDRPHDLALDLRGTPFQKSVWRILLKVPFGRVSTYGEVARAIAASRGMSRMSARAVGHAVGRNPISILVPCHRVVGSDKTLTGYGGGLDKKEALLGLEGVDLATAVPIPITPECPSGVSI